MIIITLRRVMNSILLSLGISFLSVITTNHSIAQNPFIRDQFTADPSARVVGDRVYVFPSHDIQCAEGQGRGPTWFCMEDYHVFSSSDLMNWTDHGVIVSQSNVAWANKNSYSMWAPDCIERNGKYYFYFPTIIQDTVKYWRGFGIGVAVADKPEGPYTIQPEPIKDVHGIDPNVFIDKDARLPDGQGQAYLYWSEKNIYGAKLKDNMLELASEVKILGELPDKGLKEGPYMVERNGIYYLTYPHVENKIERLEYAIGDNPLGPFKFAGVIMDESPTGCWTNHHSFIQFKDQWYLFYHHNDYSPQFDKNRSIRVDSLFFNADGSIKKVIPTLRGVGITDARNKIEIDRYSHISDKGVSIAFLDTSNKFQGWKTVFNTPGAWVQYNSVDFGNKKLRSISARVSSGAGGTLQVRADGVNGTLLGVIKLKATKDWSLVKVPVLKSVSGVHHVVVVLDGNGDAEVDWISFE